MTGGSKIIDIRRDANTSLAEGDDDRHGPGEVEQSDDAAGSVRRWPAAMLTLLLVTLTVLPTLGPLVIPAMQRHTVWQAASDLVQPVLLALLVAATAAVWLHLRRLLGGAGHRNAADGMAADMRLLTDRSQALSAHLAAVRLDVAAQARALDDAALSTVAALRTEAGRLTHAATDLQAARAGLEAVADASSDRFANFAADVSGVEERLIALFERADAQVASAVAQAGGMTQALERLHAVADDAREASAQAQAAHLATADTMEARAITQTAQLSDAAAAIEARLAQIGAAQERELALIETRLTDLARQTDAALARFADATTTTLQTLTLTGGELAQQLGGAEAAGERLERHLRRLSDDSGGLRDRIENDVTPALVAAATAGAALSSNLGAVGPTAQTAMAVADQARERTEALLGALDAVAREAEVTLPAALVRLDDHGAQTRTLLAQLAPSLSAADLVATSTLDQLRDAVTQLHEAESRLEALAGRSAGVLADQQGLVRTLSDDIAACSTAARQFADASAPMMVGALVQVRETAAQAATRSREAFESVVTQAEAALRQAADRALDAPFRQAIADALHTLEAQASAATERARAMTDALDERIAHLAASTAQATQAVAQAEARLATSAQDAMAHRAALLIDKLRSQAIDIGRLWQSDVPDTTWDAYLKGDRSVFTRRAVRLLDAGDTRELARHLRDDTEFRSHVADYVATFETMLRGVMSARDGQGLAVTLMSSDMGKLYAALAQALDRQSR